MNQDDKQIAQDMLRALENQRNAAQNECVQIAAQLMAAQRRIAELEKGAAPDVPADVPAKNGHDHDQVSLAA